MAWLLQAAPASRRGELIGTAVGSAIAGALLGPVVGGVASAAGQAVTFIGVAALAVGLGLFALRADTPPRGEAQTLGDVRRALASPAVRLAGWLVVLPALSSSTMSVLVPLRLAELGLVQLAIAGTFLVAAGGEALVKPGGRAAVGPPRPTAARGDRPRCRRRADRSTPVARRRMGRLPGFVLATMALGTFWAPAIAMLSDCAEATGSADAAG